MEAVKHSKRGGPYCTISGNEKVQVGKDLHQ